MKKVSLLLFVSLLFVAIDFVSCDDGGGGGGGAPGAPGGKPATAPVPQTGQTTCWDPELTQPLIEIPCNDPAAQGEDGAVQAGVMPPDPRFEDNGDGTITDNQTRLVWLKNANCLGGRRTWRPALAFANGLKDGECGLSDGSIAGDWRLPNRKELESLIDLGNVNPALPSGNPFIDIQHIDAYWSSTTVFGDPLRAFDWIIEEGRLLITDKRAMDWVLPVRGGL